MGFRIADTFLDSLAKLTGNEQKAVKNTAFDLQVNPAQPGHQLHRLDGARDPNFWSVRVSRDIRIIVHRTGDGFMLCYVDHHDQAYRWGERRRLETHPSTGAAQLVEVRETVREVITPEMVTSDGDVPPKSALFANKTDDELLSYGVPDDWLEEVRRADEDSILDIADHLPKEAAEALLQLATGGPAQPPRPVPVGVAPFDHPDAQRRFRIVSDLEELARALDYPWEKWSVFLHPSQREVVGRDYNGPAKVSGSAGTGKTVVALHRAVHLARTHEHARVLLTTFSDTLADSLRAKLRVLVSGEPQMAERVEVHSIVGISQQLYQRNFGEPAVASREAIAKLMEEAVGDTEAMAFSKQFLIAEWEQVVDDWQLRDWEAYRDVPRIGRRRRLSENQRRLLWSVFEHVQQKLEETGQVTQSQIFGQLAGLFAQTSRRPFDFVVVDEAQDVGVAQLRFLAALALQGPNNLFLAGDLGQRIFQQPFSWKALGVDIRGRSHTLRINYRTSHQIRSKADSLLAPELSDVDGNAEERHGTVSVFNGPHPVLRVLETSKLETESLAEWLKILTTDGLTCEEIAVFVRSEDEVARAVAGIEAAGLSHHVLPTIATDTASVTVSTMHLAKGLEFRAVAVIACDEEVIPSQTRIESIADQADLEDVYNTERHLLYVACTRARDHLLVTGVSPGSEFLSDLGVLHASRHTKPSRP